MVLHAMGHGRAMVHCVGMNEALDRVIAMPEGENGWRGDEAKGCERGEHYRQPEAEPGPERSEHVQSLVLGVHPPQA
jgi:hypothetical protein